jgi:hypothetical protein
MSEERVWLNGLKGREKAMLDVVLNVQVIAIARVVLDLERHTCDPWHVRVYLRCFFLRASR